MHLPAVQSLAEQLQSLKASLAAADRRAADLGGERDSLAAQLADLQQHNSHLLSQVCCPQRHTFEPGGGGEGICQIARLILSHATCPANDRCVYLDEELTAVQSCITTVGQLFSA